MRKHPRDFFIYCRKSTEDGRQSASIRDQLRELDKVVTRHNLTVVDSPLIEEKSAKAPGRPMFSEMLDRIEQGEANALLCWDVDRLYRNPVDEGRVRWMLQNKVIKEIRTPHRQYTPQDAGLLMGVEGGRAVDHIITLRKGVLRGFRGKLQKGWRPGLAPPGYLNDTNKEQGERTISPDPERFDLIRRAWDLMLTGDYSVRDIQRLAEAEWGLRTPKSKKRGGEPYTLSAWYRIFSQPFYYGKFWWKKPGTDTYQLYEGAHEAMITKAEFDRVQLRLGRKKNQTRRENLDFPFTGLIRCGECGGRITAERKYQVRCSECSTKFSALHRDDCRQCGVLIDEMDNPNHLRYVYYHCTKRKKGRSCSQPSVRGNDLADQIDQILKRVAISGAFKDWAIRALRDDTVRTEEAEETVLDSLNQRAHSIQQELDHLNDMILSPDTDWSLITREEVKEKKLDLLAELEEIEDKINAQRDRGDRALELSKRTFKFAAAARFWLREGGTEQKRKILATLGSNRTLTDKTLELELKKPFRYLADLKKQVPAVSGGFEPDGDASRKAKTPQFNAEIPLLCGTVNAVRTYWLNNPNGQIASLPLHRDNTIQDAS